MCKAYLTQGLSVKTMTKQKSICSLDADDDDKKFSAYCRHHNKLSNNFFLLRLIDLIEGFMVAELMLTKRDNNMVNTQ